MRGILRKSAPGDYSHMKRKRSASLSPRKKPQQRRSRVTIDAIFEAAIQVLLANGLERVTTIQIADRAGVSVGSLYQYFPNKNALLAAIVKRHVGQVTDTTIAACNSAHGKTIGEMCATMMSAFVDAKTRLPEVSRALYLPSAAVNADAIVKEESGRCIQAVHDMLITASDATFSQPQVVSRMLVGSIIGPTRAVIEAGGNRATFDRLKLHLTALTVGYLKEVSTPALAENARNAPAVRIADSLS
jgi:AcrR family transcriptional regulator